MSRSLRQTNNGQGMVEYVGMLVLGVLVVAGVLSGAYQLMPALFETMTTNNQTALQDQEPAPPGAPSPAPSPAP